MRTELNEAVKKRVLAAKKLKEENEIHLQEKKKLQVIMLFCHEMKVTVSYAFIAFRNAKPETRITSTGRSSKIE